MFIHHDQLAFFSGCKDVSMYTNQYMGHINRMNKKPHGHLNKCIKPFDKIQCPFVIKILHRIVIEENTPHRVNVLYDNPTTTIILSCSKLKSFCQDQEDENVSS